MFKYEIGDKTYTQRKLVMGQIEQLEEQLRDAVFPMTNDPLRIREALGNKVYMAFAISLVEEGKSPKRDIEELQAIADDLRWGIDPELTLQVIEDFFDCNPIASLFMRLEGLTKKIKEMAQNIQKVGSKELLTS